MIFLTTSQDTSYWLEVIKLIALFFPINIVVQLFLYALIAAGHQMKNELPPGVEKTDEPQNDYDASKYTLKVALLSYLITGVIIYLIKYDRYFYMSSYALGIAIGAIWLYADHMTPDWKQGGGMDAIFGRRSFNIPSNLTIIVKQTESDDDKKESEKESNDSEPQDAPEQSEPER
ncbi:MAG: hypothetical protein HDR79_02410 [Bacteroides sp.]|nr:hypothetical protein [Bacteroides sp.]MBD5361640.1 hypothetical protein [Bacteroides sp.]MBD5363786.1 hypothetical protein [Bacteroides sp.]